MLLSFNIYENFIFLSSYFNHVSLSSFFTKILLNILSVTILIKFIYYKKYKHKFLFFPLIIFNILIFLITYLLSQSNLSIGAAFGLFAVFSFLRYRSENISIKNLTYLFISISIGLVSALSNLSWVEVSIIDGIILLSVFISESYFFSDNEQYKQIILENINLLHISQKQELKNHLEKKLGIKIKEIEIIQIDYSRDTALLNIYFENEKLN